VRAELRRRDIVRGVSPDESAKVGVRVEIGIDALFPKTT
jgi:hypothetical protein